MSEQEKQTPLDLGIFARAGEKGALSSTEIIAGVASVIWLIGVTIFFGFTAGQNGVDTPQFDPIRFVVMLIAIVMPIGLIWVAAMAIRSSKVMKEESERLQAAINAMRHTYIQQQQSGILSIKPGVEQKLDEIAAAQRKTDAKLLTFASVRANGGARVVQDQVAATTATQPSPAREQASLALGTPAEDMAPPLSIDDYIRALHFPETTEDKEGFRALRLALQDHNSGQLVRAAQDVLTLLSQDGIYMDDLKPDHASPDIWRRFARGERGKPIAVLGGIRDRSSLALTAGRMRQDPIFRDCVHHFLRKFDHGFTRFEKTANDQDIIDLADTRTARAFMLLGRSTGTFD